MYEYAQMDLLVGGFVLHNAGMKLRRGQAEHQQRDGEGCSRHEAVVLLVRVFAHIVEHQPELVLDMYTCHKLHHHVHVGTSARATNGKV